MFSTITRIIMRSILYQFLAHVSLKKKIIFGFLSVSILCLIALSFMSYQYMRKIMNVQIESQAEDTVNLICASFDSNLSLIIDRFNMLTFDSQFQEYLQMDEDSVDTITSKMRREISRMMTTTYSSIIFQTIQVYADNGLFFELSDGSENVLVFTDDLKARAEEANGKMLILYVEEDPTNIQLIKMLKDSRNQKKLGYLRAAVKKSYFNGLIKDVDFAKEGAVFVYDQEGALLLGEGSWADDTHLPDASDGKIRTVMNGQDMLIIYDTLEGEKWKIVGLIPMSLPKGNIWDLYSTGFLLALVLILLCFMIGNVLAKDITKPVDEIVKAFTDFSEGDFNSELPVNRSDEMGRLAKGFNEMRGRINTLINENYQTKLLRQESELKMLQAQINPHFFYNTLDAINWMAKAEGKDEICKMISAVGNLMRISISNKKSFITVREEIKYVEEYLYIQKFRYRDKLSTQIEVEPETYDYIIPKLILEPIVENAVVHGIEGKKGGGSVFVYGNLKDGFLQFEIYDTGLGLKQEIIDQILHSEISTNDTTHAGMGSFIVRQRLQYLYGDNSKFSIESCEGAYTRVTIQIPAQEQATIA